MIAHDDNECIFQVVLVMKKGAGRVYSQNSFAHRPPKTCLLLPSLLNPKYTPPFLTRYCANLLNSTTLRLSLNSDLLNKSCVGILPISEQLLRKNENSCSEISSFFMTSNDLRANLL